MFDSLLYSTAYAVSKADELWGSSRSFHTNYSEGGFTPESLEHAFDTEDLMGIDLSSADAEDELTDRIGVVDEFALADVDTNIYVFFMETLGWILSFVGLVATVMVIKE
ncbi:MAG: hypothetical protein U9Q15_05050 [Patescibacteria group bacterium]|nr:hypothetical protein [Patescibacteria group bacterium]